MIYFIELLGFGGRGVPSRSWAAQRPGGVAPSYSLSVCTPAQIGTNFVCFSVSGKCACVGVADVGAVAKPSRGQLARSRGSAVIAGGLAACARCSPANLFALPRSFMKRCPTSPPRPPCQVERENKAVVQLGKHV